MDDIRKPCEHRGTPAVLTSALATPQGEVDFCICKDCRRFWLERDGWLLSQRETMSLMRNWPAPSPLQAAR